MKYIISIILIFNISLVNANEIFNLLKIPNLEIYNTNSSNGLKYLYAEKNFKIGLKKNISCDRSKKNKLDKKYPVVEKNLNKYNADFLIKNNLKFIILCENLSVSSINTGGVPNILKRSLILDINFNMEHFERMIHHEFFHMIQAKHNEIFDETLWSNFNKTTFKYAECSTCSDRTDLSLYKNTDGFLTEYSKSIPSEDMAEIFSFLMTNKELVENIIQSDLILKNKVEYLKKNLKLIDNSFIF
jgi:hypothetical protein